MQDDEYAVVPVNNILKLFELNGIRVVQGKNAQSGTYFIVEGKIKGDYLPTASLPRKGNPLTDYVISNLSIMLSALDYSTVADEGLRKLIHLDREIKTI